MNPLILYNNIITESALESSALESGYNVQNIKDGRPYTFVKFANPGTNYIIVDPAANTNASAVAISGHNFGTVGATLTIQRWNGSEWVDITILDSNYVAGSNKNQLYYFGLLASTKFKIIITNTLGLPYVGVVSLSYALQMEYPPDGPRAPFTESIVADTEYSEDGNLLGTTIKYNPVMFTHTYTNLTRTFVQQSYLTFWNTHGKLLKPFFYSLDLDYEPDVFYGIIDPASVHQTPASNLNYYDELTLQMKGTI